jgi:hypothetical protein
MFLDYLALVILIMGLLLVFYGFIYIHDIPYAIAKKRHHPHKEAIHVACWLSLFTLHAIWPIVYIWAVYKPRPVRVSIVAQEPDEVEDTQQELHRLREQVKALQLDQSTTKVESPS